MICITIAVLGALIVITTKPLSRQLAAVYFPPQAFIAVFNQLYRQCLSTVCSILRRPAFLRNALRRTSHIKPVNVKLRPFRNTGYPDRIDRLFISAASAEKNNNAQYNKTAGFHRKAHLSQIVEKLIVKMNTNSSFVVLLLRRTECRIFQDFASKQALVIVTNLCRKSRYAIRDYKQPHLSADEKSYS